MDRCSMPTATQIWVVEDWQMDVTDESGLVLSSYRLRVKERPHPGSNSRPRSPRERMVLQGVRKRLGSPARR
jgi:hypothetical protein